MTPASPPAAQPARAALATGADGALLAGAAAIVFALPAAAYARLLLFHFYVRGAVLLDSGLLAHLIWHDDLRLTMPPALDGQSFFAFHAAPILLLFGAISRVLPFTMPQFLAAFIGASYGMLALAILWLLVEGLDMRRGPALAVAAAVSIGFACSGLAIAIALYPHFEVFEAACLLLFLVALALRRSGAATVWFTLAVATREDAGLHAAALLVVVLVAQRLRGIAWPERRAATVFAAAGVVCSLAALAAQHIAFPYHSSFQRVYLGTPPFAHLDAGLVAARIGFFLCFRPYLVWPAFGLLGWAARRRSFIPLAGLSACLPWTLLHLLAASPLAGLMVGYYAFPFLLAFAWPLIGAVIAPAGNAAAPERRATLGWFMVVLALGWVPLGGAYNPTHIPLPEAVIAAPSAARQAATDAAIAALLAARPQLGRLVAGNAVVALRPDAFARREVAGWQADAPDTVALFADGYDSARLRRLAAQDGLDHADAAPGTSILLFSRLPLDAVPALRRAYRAVDAGPAGDPAAAR